MHESEMHADSAFVTLTYAWGCLPKNDSLKKTDCQLFMKRLRQRIVYDERASAQREGRRAKPPKIKFFLSGEYGGRFGRPHYHLIVFGFGFPDRKPLDGKKLFTSELLSGAWGKGFCSIGDVTFESASYVAKYVVDKVTNKKGHKDRSGKYWPSASEVYGERESEFALMSKGIGKSWIQEFKSDVYPRDGLDVYGRRAKPPRYYDGIVREDDPEAFEKVAEKRREKGSRVVEFVTKDDGRKYLVEEGRCAPRLKAKETCALARVK